MQSEWRIESLEMAQEIAAHARSRGMSPTQFAVQWVLNNRCISSAIAGPRTLAQMQDYLEAHEHPFEAQDEALINRMVAPGHPSTPGYSDPAYPIEGRPIFTTA
jgi:aryl-alcohol dehydrogenase-like predicted oxidoreductase